MRRLLVIFGSAISLTLAGCATTSFAPPLVTIADPADPANPTLLDSIKVVDGFIDKYRTQMRSAANGRQVFEVPPIVASVGAVAAAAFGAGTDVTIATGAGAALLGSGKAYYDPKAKAAIYDSAYGALLCIQQVATGVKPFADAAASSDNRAYAEAANGDSYAYYLLIKNAALNVERIAGRRLSNVGSLSDAEGIAAQYEKAVTEKRAKEAAAATDLPPSAGKRANFRGLTLSSTQPSVDELKRLNAMQPDLELCVLRAKT